MKKLLLTSACFFTLLSTQAQIANGSVAPDFTATDVFGISHTLSEYLAQGKTVILDISATWCGPCWNYHSSGALERLYYSLGQGGSGEVVVLFIEGDSNTDVECLFGICPNNSTHGNWVEHSPYPVIDSAPIAQLYQISYFPTIFRICPNGIVNTLNQLPGQELVENISSNCDTSTGIQKNARPHIDDIMLCEAGAISPEVTISNYGSETISTATVQLKQGEAVLASKSFTGNIYTFNDGSLAFDPINLNPDEEYTVKITQINGAVTQQQETTTSHFNVTQAKVAYNNIAVKVLTDTFPGEISWAIKNSAGTTVASGGPYEQGTQQNPNGGGPNANTTLTHNVTLPGTNADCYSVELYDSYGDGWSSGTDNPTGVQIWSGGEKIFEKRGDDFSYQSVALPAFKATGTLTGPAAEATHFVLYPNPAKGIIYFSGVTQADVVIYNLFGKIVYTIKGIENGTSINLTSLQKGLYIARITEGNATKTEKIILN